MPVPEDKLSEIMAFDFDALSVLVGEPPGVNYNIGLVTLTLQPAGLEETSASKMPWLLQTDGRGESLFQPSSQVSDNVDLIYMGYVRPDPQRFPDLSAPQIRRGLMADISQVLDIAEHRQAAGADALVFDRSRTWESFDDPLGKWSLFVITETVFFHREIGS